MSTWRQIKSLAAKFGLKRFYRGELFIVLSIILVKFQLFNVLEAVNSHIWITQIKVKFGPTLP